MIILNCKHTIVVFLITSIGLVYISSQLILGQSNISNTENKIKVPSHLDIESQSTRQEMAAINKSASNSTNATEQAHNETNITNNSNQSLHEFANGTMAGDN